MAKVDTIDEELPMPTTGRWIWKEDTNSLEFAGSHQVAEHKDGKKKKGKGGIHFHDTGKRNDRAKTPMFGAVGRMGAGGVGKGTAGKGYRPHRGSPKPSMKQTGTDGINITLDHVKAVALDLLQEVAVSDLPDHFSVFSQTEQFDSFLISLLNYFSCYFERLAQEKKPTPMTTEPSLAEKKAMAEASARMAVAQKRLGQSYCVLILGLGIPRQHHMGCGMKRVSSTYTDRSMYEALYNVCTYVTWVTFRRRDFELIQKETGRMLRSDVFNPSLRPKSTPEDEEEEMETKEDKKGKRNLERKRISPAEHRRRMGKRPPIKEVVNQRSPALVSILPNPKEEAPWLFQHQPTGKGDGTTAPKPFQELSVDMTEEEFEIFLPSPLKTKVGIIGEPMSQYNPQTLTPLGAEQDEENEADSRRNSLFGSPAKSPANTRQGSTAQNRMMTSMSMTTDAFSVVDEDE
ncbi:protein phosphatase 1 regulatory subunit 36-like isoform X1 [Branchiostoma floridae]|uniref:Protein phosphatase 1 regulatory subunit 36-like isoform X1 n=1 Tax=Branchiostoma floridae TaxID=7739 RepID=A0A9J7KLW0_BRAFL|nr:protein phosphatase 1 regulatory subunit 36-like isoform X1 [Branchiostoma floridae]